MDTPKKPGLYLVTLNNSVPISVNAHDPRIADKCIKVNKDNCKFGKARNLLARRQNYYKTFGKENVNFQMIARLDAIDTIEKRILNALDQYRIRGRTGRKNEWLEGIEPEHVLAIAIANLH